MGELWNGLKDLIGSGLSFFYDLIPNYGIAIIFLTIVISVLLFPLTLKQTRSMKAMQEIQPEVKRLQKELKGDREQLNQEMMALYKERNVNPAAGCLPMIVQLPIWFALFQVLRSPIESLPTDSALGDYLADRGKVLVENGMVVERGGDKVATPENYDKFDFLGMNLQFSPSDVFSLGSILEALPYVVLILAVVATGYYQTRQTMARQKDKGEQTQQQQTMQNVMKFFPVFFGVISWGLPAGLVLYFAVSQLFRIGQQALILRLDGDGASDQPSRSAEAPPARRANSGRGDGRGKAGNSSKPGTERQGFAEGGQPRPPSRAQTGSKKKRKRRKR